MKVAIIVGSHSMESQSTKVGGVVAKKLEERGTQTYVLDLKGNPLPLWDESVWEGSERWAELWGPVSSELDSSDAIVVISPEWSGMVPAGLKNFFLLCSTEIAHKPGLIVTVSASSGGSYPVAELRMSSYKNTRLCYIPEHVIVRNVNDVLEKDDGAELSREDEYVRKRLDYSLSLLVEYAQAMAPIRRSETVQDIPKEARHGM